MKRENVQGLPNIVKERAWQTLECQNGKESDMAESRNKRVLIVDNDEEESGRLGVMLQRAGYDSYATWSGLEALELLKSGDYDILLVSSYLPDVYVGDFMERLNRLPVRPCSIVMQEGRTPAATVLEMKNIVGQERAHVR
jgi:CheY-like chemotaxis protein